MNTKGVEDGMDTEITWVPVYVERAICDLIPDTGHAREIARVGWAWDEEHPGYENALNRWKNEAIRQRRDLIALQELIEHEKNPFPSAAVPVEERTRVNHIWSGKEKMPCGCSAKTEYPYFNAETGHIHCIACGTAYSHQSQIDPVVPERTAEMEQLMGRLRELNGRGVLLYSSEVKILMDHIEGKAKAVPTVVFCKCGSTNLSVNECPFCEGKAKAVSQEVKE